jgi:hypothetical protein
MERIAHLAVLCCTARFRPGRCPLRVIRDHGGRSHSIAHVRFATESGQVADHLGKSALCQKRTRAVQHDDGLFNHLVGKGEQRWWQCDAECLSGLEVDGEQKTRWPQYG